MFSPGEQSVKYSMLHCVFLFPVLTTAALWAGSVLATDVSCQTNENGTFHCQDHDPKLTSVPREKISDTTKEIDLSQNNITFIQKKDFKGLVKVQKLVLSFNSIAKIPKNVFSAMPSLESLQLVQTNIFTIDEKAFSGLKDLKELNISGNELTTLHAKTFSPLAALETVDLGWNLISNLPETMFSGSKSLISLNLKKNKLKSVGFVRNIPNVIQDAMAIVKQMKEQIRREKNPIGTAAAAASQEPGITNRGAPFHLDLSGNRLKCCPLMWLRQEELLGNVRLVAPRCVEKQMKWTMMTENFAPHQCELADLASVQIGQLPEGFDLEQQIIAGQ